MKVSVLILGILDERSCMFNIMQFDIFVLKKRTLFTL